MSNLLEKASILLTPTAYDDGKILSVKPIDGSGDFDFTRNSSATRVNSQGLIEDMQTFGGDLVSNGDFSQEGSELITNGDFATDSDWTKQAGWTISGGKANCDGTQTAGTQLVQNGTYTLNKTYKITYTLSSVTAGNVDVRLQGSGATVTGNSRTTDGTYTEYITSTGNTSFRIRGNDDFIGSIDNVSVKEVGQDWTLDGEAELTAQGARIYSSSGSYSSVRQSNDVLTIGNKYKITFNVISTNGTSLANGNSNITYDTSTTGNKTFYITASEVVLAFKRAAAITTDVTITNISVIEITDDTNLPRIDYSPYSGAGTCGHWLFEPQSTNLLLYSQDFSQNYWGLTSATVTTSTITDPTGDQNSFKLVPNSGTGGNRSISNNFVGLSGLHTQSVFAKKGEYNYIALRTRNNPNTSVMFDLENGTFNVNLTSVTFVSAKIEDYGSGWYKCSMTVDPSQMSNAGQVYTSFSVGITGNETNNFNGDGTSGIYIFGAQFEQQSYPTSYIPTSGSTVTRNQEAAFGAGSSSLINSTEGVLYTEIAALANDSTVRRISLTDGTVNNRVEIAFFGLSNRINVSVKASGTDTFNAFTSSYDITQFNKIAIKYKVDDFNLFVNGVKLSSDTSGSIPTGLDTLNFNSGSGSFNFFGKTKCVAVFKEALTDDELECLTSDETSFSSFNALALANNYTII